MLICVQYFEEGKHQSKFKFTHLASTLFKMKLEILDIKSVDLKKKRAGALRQPKVSRYPGIGRSKSVT